MEIRNPGFGMRYFRFRNVITSEGVCEICDQLVALTSCDATVFFAPFSLPLVPLGKERIIDHCPSCGRHRAMTQGAFLAQRDADYDEVSRLLEDEWLDELNALDALRLVCGYREPAMVHRVVRQVQRALPQSPEAHLFIAETHRLMGNFVLAEEATYRSLNLRESDEVRESLAEFQFNRGDIGGGIGTLAPLCAAKRMIPFRAVRAGVLALQRAGRHHDALELLERASLASDSDDMAEEFQSLRGPSEWAVGVGSSRAEVLGDAFAGPSNVRRREPQTSQWL